jgi:hypothetical protein
MTAAAKAVIPVRIKKIINSAAITHVNILMGCFVNTLIILACNPSIISRAEVPKAHFVFPIIAFIAAGAIVNIIYVSSYYKESHFKATSYIFVNILLAAAIGFLLLMPFVVFLGLPYPFFEGL